jgi:hypothetical protein
MRVYSGHGRGRKKKRTDMMSAGVYEKKMKMVIPASRVYALSITY